MMSSRLFDSQHRPQSPEQIEEQGPEQQRVSDVAAAAATAMAAAATAAAAAAEAAEATARPEAAAAAAAAETAAAAAVAAAATARAVADEVAGVSSPRPRTSGSGAPLVEAVRAEPSSDDSAVRYVLLLVCDGGHRRQVRRRYHEFRALRNALRAAAPHLAAQIDAPFPPKRLGLRRSHRSGKRDPQVIEGRAVALHRWLAEALTLGGAVQLPAIRAFLYLDRPR